MAKICVLLASAFLANFFLVVAATTTVFGKSGEIFMQEKVLCKKVKGKEVTVDELPLF